MPGTYPFPTRYGVVEGSYRDLIEGSKTACKRLCETAQKLEKQGALAIVGDCGLMALYQNDIAEAVSIPVVSSSLILLPLAKKILNGKRIGILTGHSELLKPMHLAAAGVDDSQQLIIQGMENESHFRSVVIEGTGLQVYERMARDVLHAVGEMLRKLDNVKLILLECSNLAAFAWEIERTYQIPVWDVNLAVQMLYLGRNPVCYRSNSTATKAVIT